MKTIPFFQTGQATLNNKSISNAMTTEKAKTLKMNLPIQSG